MGDEMDISKRAFILGAVGVLLLSALLYFLVSYRSAAQVQVTRMTWMRAINIERWWTVQESDWSVPQGGREIRSYSDIHHWERYVSGSHQDCSMTGTGSNQRTSCTTELDYSSRPVYQTKYDYWVERWVVVKTPKREGENTAPAWPDVSDLKASPALTIGDERAGMRTSRYTVEFTQGYTLDLTEERWRGFKPGQRVTLILNIFKQAMDVQL